MKNHIIRFFTIACLLALANGTQAGNTLFEIGRKDGKAAEFALSPNHYKNFLIDFTGVKHYAVGYSQPHTNWPYVLPGPKDSWGGGGYWAGFHPRHFPIIDFQLDKVKTGGTCRLALHFCGASAAENPVLRIEINGHRMEKQLEGKSTDKLLAGQESASPLEWQIDFPSDWLATGMNQIQMGLVKGRWCMFDCIRLTAPEEVTLQPISSSLITSIKAADFTYQPSAQRCLQPVMVEMIQETHDVKDNCLLVVPGN